VNKFELTPAFFIGHKEIDADHAALVSLLNKMVDAYMAEDLTACHDKWQQFCHKLEIHFATEVAIMQKFEFRESAGHEEEHQEIIKIAKSLGEGCTTLGGWETCLFTMRDSLLSLILKRDLKFAEHLVTIGYNRV
tara:strand:- start:9397 stop:9801 length:405 start_codon:yes stop_codon:yes gene_type:complete